MVKGWSPISVREGVKQELEEIYQSDKRRPKNQKFTAYIENMLLQKIDFEKSLEEHGHIFKFETVDDNHIILMDNFIGKHVFVNFHEKILYCEEHNTIDCAHVGFCYGIPEVYKALIDKGLKPKILRGYKKKMP